jgi:nucleotide-binding universal stress UspA family protein
MVATAKRILVAYDGSQAARRALDRAAELAGYGSTVTVVTVIVDPHGSRSGAGSAAVVSEARRLLAARHIYARTIEVSGEPAATIVRTAREERADLLLVGQRNGDACEPVGSVSRAVVRQSPCDVLVVR